MGGKDDAFTFSDYVTLIWFLIDAFTHLTIELGYVYLALTSTAKKSPTFLGFIWREYSRCDVRWAGRDPNVISIEILTVFVGILCIVNVQAILKRKPYRHPLQIMICVSELYGGWMTFAPEWLEGNPNLNGSTFTLFWIYLVFMNGLWVVLPGLLLWDSIAQTTAALALPKPRHSSVAPGAPSTVSFAIAAGFLVLYMVLVPAVLFSAEGVPVDLAAS